MAVEIVSPGQTGLFAKAQRYVSDWGVQSVWMIDPQTREAFEYSGEHPGGPDFRLRIDELRAGDIALCLSDIFDE